jgi:putative transposase
MHFEPDDLYHVYNRGNEKQKLFFNRENYLFFLRKVRKEWRPYADVLVYCLMPNHFHFILKIKSHGCDFVVLKGKQTHMQNLSKTIGKTLSSYTQAINLERSRTGNLFQKKTKAKNLRDCHGSYLINCVHYIHSNPVAAGLVEHDSEWEFSSFPDYCGVRKGTLCNKELLYEVSGISENEFQLSKMISEATISDFF